MKRSYIIIAALVMSCALSGCSSTKMLLDDTSKLDSIDKVQIALAMGNPEYGAESKIITDKDEIKELVDAFNNAIVGEEVKTGEILITSIASYYFYSDSSLVQRFVFNGNNTEHIFLNSKCYYVKYPDKSPYELYQQSKAEIITVDEELYPFGDYHNVNADTEPNYVKVNDLDGVTLEIKEGTLSATELTVIARNESKEDITFGSYYCVEKKVNGAWHRLPYIVDGEVGWDEVGYVVVAGNKYGFSKADWEWLYGSLESGSYRFIKDGFVGRDGNITKHYFAVEFSID